jgi:hypothetical protein
MGVLPNHATIRRVVPKVCMGHYTREIRDVMKSLYCDHQLGLVTLTISDLGGNNLGGSHGLYSRNRQPRVYSGR